MNTWAVDIDDTLYSFNHLSREVLGELARLSGDDELIRAAYAPWPEWRSPSDVMSLEMWTYVISLCHETDMISQQVPFKGTYDSLWKIIDSGDNILYISNRSESAYGATAAWIEGCGFPSGTGYDSEGQPLSTRVQLVCTSDSKKPYVSHCRYIIDDRPKTLVEFVYDYDWKNKHGSDNNTRKGFGLHTTYNQALTDVPGIYLAPTWPLLDRYLERALVPSTMGV